jgi:hypothetical protein
MKRLLVGLTVALSFPLLADKASAQGPCPCTAGGGSYTGATFGSGGIIERPGVGGAYPIATLGSPSLPILANSPSPGQVFPYSYYVTSPYPARAYVGFGPADSFPFYGRAYGNPGDRWSWYYMGGGDRRYLAKYYYPLLR